MCRAFSLPRYVAVAQTRIWHFLLCGGIVVAAMASACSAQQLTLVPDHPTGIYSLGESVGWTVTQPNSSDRANSNYSFTAKKNNFDLIKSGELDLATGPARIELKSSEPAMIYLEVVPKSDGLSNVKPIVAGAAVAPEQLKPVASCPDDFDKFWNSKIAELHQIPSNPVIQRSDSGDPNIDYATVTFDNINNTHVHGQFAKPAGKNKLPALVIFQWASPPYPLQKEWVTSRAAQGWLTLNVEPHDVLPDQPQSYYDALPDSLKHYESIGNNDREKSYFLRMYLGDYRALDYITGRPDWDGKTLVIYGISMGGQQGLCLAGLHPKVTHLIVNVPAGCDTNGPLHSRQASYPNFPADDPQIMRTALYFDAVNFAPRIRAQCLVAMGFVDTACAPAGIWTAYNLIPGPKEVAPMPESPHNHVATPEQQRPFTERSAAWLDALIKGDKISPPNATPSAKAAAKTSIDDHQNMMQQLGIKELRPGADPNRQNTFDEQKANELLPTLPDVLTMNDGQKVTRAEDWPQRRAEIAELFEREIYGRIPANVPQVKWEVTSTMRGESNGRSTITKTVVGHVDNSAHPTIEVDIQASFTVPECDKPVPLMIAFGRRFNGKLLAGRPGPNSWTDQAIQHGWGYAVLDTQSIQPDSADGLRTGIIGLTNHGEARAPDQWGALRAWQWGASRLLDYFETNADANVDPRKVGIEGLSRYGKAALITEAFDPRFAVGLIGSSGAGGAKLYRHVFGETAENLAGGGHYWMAGNFIKYSATDATFGARTTADLPIDAHELIALCSPRPCFISYGTVDGGDPQWVDAHGSYMAGTLATSVYRLLGKSGFGEPANYLSESMPPVGQLVGGELAWRQHSGGHDVTPNWPTFFEWVGKYIQSPANTALSTTDEAALSTSDASTAGEPIPRTDANSKLAHEQLIAKAKRGGIDLYFVGDSITRRWGCTDPQYAALLENWKANFFGWNAANFGWGADTTQNILWRLQNGELEGVNPKVIVLLAGTNDVAAMPTDAHTVAAITKRIQALIDTCREKAPHAQIIVTGIFNRRDRPELIDTITQINKRLSTLADNQWIHFINVNPKLCGADGKPREDTTFDGLHPTVAGYQLWADELKPLLTKLLGPRGLTDHAPPPTGDPSVQKLAPN